MKPLIQRKQDGRTAYVAHSTRADGDLSPSTVPAEQLAQARKRAVDRPWQALRQVHSDRVIVASHASGPLHVPVADGLVTAEPGLVLAVHSGDCVPVGFVAGSTVVAAAHAGWKGLEAGVLESTVRQMRTIDPNAEISAAVGPHIRAGQYEFGASELDRLRERFGPGIVAMTQWGTPALDLTAAIAAELERLEVDVEVWSPDCTASNADAYWSHRARQEPGRIALVAWIEPTTDERWSP